MRRRFPFFALALSPWLILTAPLNAQNPDTIRPISERSLAPHPDEELRREFARLIDQARVLVRSQARMSEKMLDRYGSEPPCWRNDPRVLPPRPVTLQRGQTAKVRLEVDLGLIFADPILELRFTAPEASGLTLPKLIRLKTEDADLFGPTEVEFEITAGQRNGRFPVKITLSPAGKPATFDVIVE